MLKKKLFFITIILILLISPFVYANNSDVIPISDTESTAEGAVNWIDSDLTSTTENYTLDNTIIGNAFVSSNNFIISSKNGGGVITGNLFAMANSVTIESDVKYATKPLEDGSYKIENINSASSISGNAYILADTFILEPGSEIDGDLYVVANTIELNKDSIIRGNVFAIGSNITINASIGQSLYSTSENFNMNSYGFVYRDANISANSSNIDGKINRNAYINIRDLSIGSNFSVAGNLEYSSENELPLSKNIVNGEIKYSKYSSKNVGNTILSVVFGLITSILYALIIAWLFKFLCDKKSIQHTNDIDFKSSLKFLGIGLASIFLVVFVSILLFICSFTTTLALVLVLVYVLILLISTPILIYYIAHQININCNIYLKISIVSGALYLLNLIPIIGSIINFAFTLTGTGMIFIKLFKKESK